MRYLPHRLWLMVLPISVAFRMTSTETSSRALRNLAIPRPPAEMLAWTISSLPFRMADFALAMILMGLLHQLIRSFRINNVIMSMDKAWEDRIRMRSLGIITIRQKHQTFQTRVTTMMYACKILLDLTLKPVLLIYKIVKIGK